MVYSDTVKAFKDALNGYSEEEKRITELYTAAIKQNEESKNNALLQLEKQYRADRNEASNDTLREENNIKRSLAERGLGFSGEAAQASLNSGLALAKRLKVLASDKSKRSADVIDGNLAKNYELSIEANDKMIGLNESKNKLLTDIASLEHESEQAALDRAAKAELQKEKLMHDRDMLTTELKAKYESVINSSNTNNKNQSTNTTINQSGSKNPATNDTESLENGVFFSPDIKPKDLARLAVQNATGSDYINSDNDAYLVNKYLLDLEESYNIPDDYMKELIFMLKAYGYQELSPKERKVEVLTRDGEILFDENYRTRYKEYVDRGVRPLTARSYALAQARKDVVEMLYKRTENRAEFMELCEALEISEDIAKSFAADKVWYDPSKDKPDPKKPINKQIKTEISLN